MAMASFNLVSLFILATFLNFAATKAQDPVFLDRECSSNRTTANSVFQFNLKTLLSFLSSNATGNNKFYNTTVAGRNPSDSVYGLFLCRGDVSSAHCLQCVLGATNQLSSECSLSKEAVIWYDKCTVRYSNRSFFSTVDTRPYQCMSNAANVSNQAGFMRLVFETMNTTADKAANSPIGVKKYATKEANISQFQTLYCLAQCTDDLSPQDCSSCLSGTIGDLPGCRDGKQGGGVLSPSCNVRYELYPFYSSTALAPAPAPTPARLVPPAKTQDPVFVDQECSSNRTTVNSAFQLNLRTLFSSLSSKATGNSKFYNTTVASNNASDSVYGLFLCRGDIPSHLCGQCVVTAIQQLSSKSECYLSKEVVIWYEECMVRYSNRSFFSTVDTSPYHGMSNTANFSNQEIFMRLVFVAMNKTAEVAANSSIGVEKYATKEANIFGFQTLFCLAQCTDDLSPQDCKSCLSEMIGLLPWCCEGKQGGRVLCPSCNIRYELYPFYRSTAPAAAPTPTPAGLVAPKNSSNSQGNTGKSRISWGKIVAIVVPITMAVLLFIVGIFFLSKRTRKKHDSIQEEKAATDITTVESLRFDFSTVETATKKFSAANKLGEGGFGEVYKGLLPSGQEIAVKRLCKSSGQGGEEFKNEVVLVAKLQHRNLVTLLGYCLEGDEKILVYEFVPNKSLDYILFDPEKQMVLNWTKRYKIIGGIAQGVQYLHEDSRLKIIHRDLKASNVLLDGDMNPKISDFGMARIFRAGQTQENTSTIVGTYGYMSPEYAMHEEFSVKSDVYSFGVLLMEIISGKKNSSFYLTDTAEDLLSYAWKLWKDGTPLEIMDPISRESCTPDEVIRCIHIGLLCVQEDPAYRPTMATIVLMLDSYSVTLPTPTQPACVLHGGTSPSMPMELQFSQSTTNSLRPTPMSVNEMSVSEVDPR